MNNYTTKTRLTLYRCNIITFFYTSLVVAGLFSSLASANSTNSASTTTNRTAANTLSTRPETASHILLVGSETDYPPYADVDRNGEAIGFSVDLIKAVANAVDLKIKFVTGPWNEVRKKLEVDEVDILPLVGYSEERDRVFDFSVQHTSNMSIFLTRSGKVKIRDLNEAKGKKIVVMEADSTHDFLVKQGFAQDLVLKKTVKEVLLSLDKKEHNLAFLPQIPAYLTMQKHGIRNIEKTGKPVDVFSGKGFSFAVREGNTELLHLLNAGLKIVQLNGQYDQFYQKWFGKILPEPTIPDYLIRYAVAASIIILLVCSLLAGGIYLLRKKVEEQTQELEIRANILKERNEKLLQLNQELEQFAHAASHDLTAPLKSISGQLRLLQDLFFENVPPQGKQLFKNMDLAIARMMQLIAGLLKYAEIGNAELNSEPVDMDRLLQTLFDDLKADINQAGAKITKQDFGTIETNPVLIRQVFQNLIINAIKYRREGVDLFIDIKGKKLGTDYWQFSIADNGQGIQSKFHQRIFQLFYRLHTQSKEGGIGLALNLCQKAITRLDGKIWLRSEVDKGSTFYFTIKQRQ